jgi:anaerobic dimethyl sulfoxide reductase subunit B
MGRQYGFYFDGDRCVQCHACEVACKSWNGLELGISWRKVRDLWSGTFPNVANKTVSLSCMHCAKPSCMEICPAKAISKRVEDGIVTVDQKKCQACRSCASACPFHVPQYGRTGVMQKCNLCLERLGQGKKPSCVATCPGEALKCGPLDTLPGLSATKPSMRFPGVTAPSMLVSGRLKQADLLDLMFLQILAP